MHNRIGVGKAVKDTVVNTVETVKGSVKAVGKMMQGDAKGALKEVKQTPLFKEGEKLVENVKQVGEGIVKGDIKKIGEGLLGVATNDLLGFIPGQKALGIGAKAIKSGVKNTIEKVAKKDAKPVKDNIVDKGFKDKKGEEKAKENKKNKQCQAKKPRRRKRADDKKDDCDDSDKDLKCATPQFVKGNGNKVFKKTLQECKDYKLNERCNYLCNAGYRETPSTLNCIKIDKKAKWNVGAACEPQECQADGFIFVESSTIKSVLDIKKNDNKGSNNDIVLYLVKFDESKKLPIYSVVYHRFLITVGKINDRANGFRVHPCTRLQKKQATDKDYLKNKYCKITTTKYVLIC